MPRRLADRVEFAHLAPIDKDADDLAGMADAHGEDHHQATNTILYLNHSLCMMMAVISRCKSNANLIDMAWRLHAATLSPRRGRQDTRKQAAPDRLSADHRASP